MLSNPDRKSNQRSALDKTLGFTGAAAVISDLQMSLPH